MHLFSSKRSKGNMCFHPILPPETIKAILPDLLWFSYLTFFVRCHFKFIFPNCRRPDKPGRGVITDH